MAIAEFADRYARNEVWFVERDPPEEAFRELGGYELRRFESSDMAKPERLAAAAAVVFSQVQQKPKRVLKELRQHAPSLLWNDCRVFVQPVPAEPGMNGPAFRQMVIEALDTLRLPPSGLGIEDTRYFGDWFHGVDMPPLTPCVHVLGLPRDWRDVARLIRANPAGFPPSHELVIDALDAEGRGLNLTPECEVLVRRAFQDCASVKLVELKNGLSDVLSFRAFAHLKQGMVGSDWPYLYFVKLGERAKIEKEFMAYRAIALENVPYHLGPRLRLDRCALGHCQGIIVSDYVSGAEALKDCAKDGRAAPAIGNLFNSTLRAWRNGAKLEETSLQQHLHSQFPLTVPVHRKHLVDDCGASLTPKELKDIFMANISKPVLVGVVHGDLHATNVLVRGNDAIIIDFEKIQMRGPLLLDMAALEGGLFVDGFIGDRRTRTDLLKSIERLYEVNAFEQDIVSCQPSDASTWFFDCVRQIRMQARQIEQAPRQYALALAMAFAKKGCNEKKFEDISAGRSREEIRALAYLLAERILQNISVKP